MFHGYGHRRVTLERHRAGEHLVQHDAHRIQIRAFVAWALGWQIDGRSEKRRRAGHSRHVESVSDAEVGEFRDTVGNPSGRWMA